MGGGEGDAEEGVGAELLFVGRAVEFDERVVERHLVGGVHAAQGGGDLVVHGVDGLAYALAEIFLFVAVAQFPGFVLAGGRPARDGRAALGTAFEEDLHLHGRVAPGVEDLEGADVGDGGEFGHKQGFR